MNMVAKSDQNLEHLLGQARVAVELPAPVTNWVMVLVRPGLEQEARDALRRRGIGAWWPNYEKEVGAKDRETGKRFNRLVRVGVLSGAILCPARLDGNFWLVIDFATGVVNVARKPSGDILLLNDVDIVLLHAIEAGLNKPAACLIAHSYAVGDKVRLIDDELRRLPPGVVIRCHKTGHLTVEVNMLGRATPVDVLPTQIEPVEPPGKNQLASKPTDARDRPAKSPSRKTR